MSDKFIRIGSTFKKPSDPIAPGIRRMETWQVVRQLDRDVFECKLIDQVKDLMLTANPQTRTFRESDILKYLNT